MSLDTAVRDLIDESLGMWRFRWAALALAWIVAVGGWIWALQLPNEWEAEARVYVDTDSLLAPLMDGLAVQQDAYDKISLMSRTLLSRPHLQAVALETGLQVRAPTPEQFESLLEKLETNIGFQETSQQKLFTITYRDHDPIMARAVVNSLLNRFMDGSFGENQSESQNAQEFILRQIEENETRLLEAEDRLADFKKRNVNLMPGSDGDYFQRLQQSQALVAGLKAKINQVELRRDEILRQLEGEEPSFGLMGAPGGAVSVGGTGNTGSVNTANGQKIAELEAVLKNMLLNLTEKHPDVLRIKQQIESLKNADSELPASSSEPPPLAGLDTLSGSSASQDLERNPVYQHMRIELSTGEMELVSLRASLEEEQKKVAFLSRMVDTIPEVEAELKRLNRDYNVVKAQYETLLARLESAKLSEEMQQDTKDVTFRIIDPPYVPIAPSGPDRLPLFTATLIFALGAAAALSYLLSQQSPVLFFLSQAAHKNRSADLWRYRHYEVQPKLQIGYLVCCLRRTAAGFLPRPDGRRKRADQSTQQSVCRPLNRHVYY